jgi:hypothetical protein
VEGELPGCWRETLAEEVALELGIARRTAAVMIELARRGEAEALIAGEWDGWTGSS